MTGIEVILAALIAGAGVGSGDVAKAAVADAYGGLRHLLRRRLAARPQAVEILDAERSEPQVWRAGFRQHLEATGIDYDDEVLAAAREVLELADPDGAQAGKYRLDLRGAEQSQVGDNSVRIGTSYGPTAGTMTGPVTVTFPGPGPVPPAAPEA